MSMVPNELKRLQVGGREIPARTWDALCRLAEDYARGGQLPNVRHATAYLKLQAQIAKDAEGAAKFVAYDPDTGWHEVSDEVTARNVGPSTAPSASIVPMLHGQGQPCFQYFTPESGGGGTATLQATTDDLDADEDGIYSAETTLATITVAADGDYLVSGTISADTTGCGDLQGTIYVGSTQVLQSYASATSGGNTHVALPVAKLALTAGQVVTLKGYAYNAAPTGVGALGKGESGPAKCWLTVVGPLAMTVA